MIQGDYIAAAVSKKVCLLGDLAVGKTSLVRRFVFDLFDDKYMSTIGVKVSRKTISVPGNDGVVELVMMLWDLASGAEFERVRTGYLRGLSGAVLVCDLTRPETLAGLQRYADEIRVVNPGAHLVLAANKRDLVEQSAPEGQLTLDRQRVEALALSFDAPHYLTSARTGDEVQELFRGLGRLLVGKGQ